jgi:hypothetical protein
MVVLPDVDDVDVESLLLVLTVTLLACILVVLVVAVAVELVVPSPACAAARRAYMASTKQVRLVSAWKRELTCGCVVQAHRS